MGNIHKPSAEPARLCRRGSDTGRSGNRARGSR